MEVFSPPRMAPEVERRGAPLGERPSCDRLLGREPSLRIPSTSGTSGTRSSAKNQRPSGCAQSVESSLLSL
eukprot:8549466-Pyramimonas_sp.AAC.1